MGQFHKSPKAVDRVFNTSVPLTRAFEDENGNRVIEGIATTPSVDRMGDVVDPMGVKFKLPLPLLWQHVPDHVVGNVVAAEVTPKGIAFRAIFAPPGAINTIDQHWTELKNGLVRYVSIGFRSLKASATKVGLKFEQWEWLELSCVTIAANPDASITSIKAFSIPETAPDLRRTIPAGEPAANPVVKTGARPMTLKEKILARKARIAELKNQLTALAEADDTDETTQAQMDELATQIEREVGELETQERALTAIEARAVAVTTGGPRSPQVMTPGTRTADRQRKPAELLFKSAAAHYMAYIHRRPVEVVLNELWPDDQQAKAYLDFIVARAASAPAMTTVPAWAGALVQDTWAEYLDLLTPLSVYAQLAAKGASFSFGRGGKVNIPARAASPNLAGDFIGEGDPIPVKQAAFTSASLTPKKLAVISTFTREMARSSGDQIQSIIRNAMLEDTARVLDSKLLDNVAATAIRPAGLLNGVTGTPSSGTALEDIIADMKAAMAPILGANGGRTLVWIMNPMQAMSLGLLTNAAGSFLFADSMRAGNLLGYSVIVSTNVPAGTIILVDAADFVTVADDSPEFDVSEAATLHMEDTAPLPINAGTPANPTRSLWQTASVGIRMLQEMNWAMRRTGMVSAITGIAW